MQRVVCHQLLGSLGCTICFVAHMFWLLSNFVEALWPLALRSCPSGTSAIESISLCLAWTHNGVVICAAGRGAVNGMWQSGPCRRSEHVLWVVQEFSADLNSRPVKRIDDVMRLRTAQFVEDAGSMAHPIRPDSYIKMDNFYTLTVYEKGAEIVRLYQSLLGKDGFRSV